LIVLGIYITMESDNIKGHAQSSIANAQFIPRIIGIALILLSVIIVVMAMVKMLRGRGAAADEAPVKRDNRFTLGLTAGLLILYALAFRPLGYIVSSVIYLFFQVLLLTPKERRTRRAVLTTTTVAVVVPVLVYIACRYGLEILLPVGLIG
jgi:putative tricarboxylic transport membrane protein